MKLTDWLDGEAIEGFSFDGTRWRERPDLDAEQLAHALGEEVLDNYADREWLQHRLSALGYDRLAEHVRNTVLPPAGNTRTGDFGEIVAPHAGSIRSPTSSRQRRRTRKPGAAARTDTRPTNGRPSHAGDRPGRPAHPHAWSGHPRRPYPTRQPRRPDSQHQAPVPSPSFNHERPDRPSGTPPPDARRTSAVLIRNERSTHGGRHARYRDSDRGRPHLDAPEVGPPCAGREADPLPLVWRNTEESALAVANEQSSPPTGGFALLLLHHHEHLARVVEKPPMAG